jgi:hypothetical protein
MRLMHSMYRSRVEFAVLRLHFELARVAEHASIARERYKPVILTIQFPGFLEHGHLENLVIAFSEISDCLDTVVGELMHSNHKACSVWFGSATSLACLCLEKFS